MKNYSVAEPSQTTLEQEPDCTTFNFIFNFVLIGTICILGLCGNTLFIVILHKEDFNKVILFLFQALAVADNSVLLMTFTFLSVIYGLLPYADSEIISMKAVAYIIKYLQPLAYVSHLCAVWITVLLAIHRYVAICIPFRAYKWNRMQHARIQVGVVLFGAIVLNVPRFFQVDIVPCEMINFQTNETVTLHYIRETEIGEHTLFGKVYTNMIYTIIGLVIPLIILASLNIQLIRAFQSGKKWRLECNQTKIKDNNVTLIMVVIIVVFLVCHTPDRIFQITKDFTQIQRLNCGYFLFYMLNACNLLISINSSINFIIYGLLRKAVRKRLLNILESFSFC